MAENSLSFLKIKKLTPTPVSSRFEIDFPWAEPGGPNTLYFFLSLHIHNFYNLTYNKFGSYIKSDYLCIRKWHLYYNLLKINTWLRPKVEALSIVI